MNDPQIGVYENYVDEKLVYIFDKHGPASLWGDSVPFVHLCEDVMCVLWGPMVNLSRGMEVQERYWHLSTAMHLMGCVNLPIGFLLYGVWKPLLYHRNLSSSLKPTALRLWITKSESLRALHILSLRRYESA